MKSPVKDYETTLPNQQESLQTYTNALSPEQKNCRKLLEQIAKNHPQVMIIEGGTANERLSLAFWYTAKLNCTSNKTPCLTCSTCLQIGAKVFCDLHLFDGSKEGVKIDDVRGLHTVISKPPQGNGKKVFIFAEAQSLRVEAANALLKSFEEPQQNICFLLLTPQKEQLLPTIISRSWTIRLAYTPLKSTISPILSQFEETLTMFLSTGEKWFDISTDKTIKADFVQQFILSIRKAIISHFTKQPKTNLEKCLAILPEAGVLHVQDLLAQAEDSLSFMVAPSLVLNWLATKIYLAQYKAKKLIQQ